MKIFNLSILFLIFNCAFLEANITPLKNIIGVDVSTFPQNQNFNYDSCFGLGANLGMQSVGLFQNWTAVEISPNKFDLTIFDIANFYYPLNNISIDLTIAPIHTNKLELPSDLLNKNFDDIILINRFKTLLDSIKVHIPDLKLNSLVIGSEHDVYLGTNETQWSQFTTFYISVTEYAKSIWPGIKVSTELTYNGIINHNIYAQLLNVKSDYIGVSYYPLNNDFTVKPITTIPTDFEKLVELYPTKQIIFYQYGYPSSILCNSSEEKQAQFISQTFTSWDKYSSNIKQIDFTWLHDLDSNAVNFYGNYYGLTDNIFLEYLQSIGLRRWNNNGADKLAFKELQCQAKLRGFNNLNIECTTGIDDLNNNKNDFILFPNPTSTITTLKSDILFKNATIEIYNSYGNLVKEIKNISGREITFNHENLVTGIYFINLLENAKLIMIDKLIICD